MSGPYPKISRAGSWYVKKAKFDSSKYLQIGVTYNCFDFLIYTTDDKFAAALEVSQTSISPDSQKWKYKSAQMVGKMLRKSSSSSSTSSGSNYDPAIELEYWGLVKDSADPDLLQSYLDEYPNGKFASIR